MKDKFNIIESLDINDPSFSNKTQWLAQTENIYIFHQTDLVVLECMTFIELVSMMMNLI